MTIKELYSEVVTPAPVRYRLRETLTISDRKLSINDLVRVSRKGMSVRVTDEPHVLDRVEASRTYITEAVEAGLPIYGVTSGFGGMADVVISPEEAAELQNNAMWYHKTGAGGRLPVDDVRAAMLLRAHSHLYGASGIRLEIIRRIALFLNAQVTPHVHEFGSIGASGDLVPLSYIAGAVMGQDACFRVDFAGEDIDCLTALERLNLPRLRLEPKEGLAMINGTSVMTGMAAHCVYDTQRLLQLTLNAHALMIQGLRGTNQSFHPFIHEHKPHKGQLWAANTMLGLLEGSQLIRDELDGQHDYRDHDLIQDRYSLRCLAQYLGPIVDGIAQIAQQVEVEMNTANDNPLIDGQKRVSYHGGNFLGEYIGVSMDQLRYYIGLLAKHLDVQISLLVSPAFSNGLPASLVGNSERKVNMGLKGLQLSGNSMMPLLLFYGNSLADRFPPHAEQFNQNINSQGFGSAYLSRQSLGIFQQYMAVALIFGVQAVDMRTYRIAGHYDARACLSPASSRLYEAVRSVVERPPSKQKPYVWNDDEQPLDLDIARIAADISSEGLIIEALEDQRNQEMIYV